MTFHRQISVWGEDHKFIDVDWGLMHVLPELWNKGMDTHASCQGHPDGDPECKCDPEECPGCSWAYIYFRELDHAKWFFDLIDGPIDAWLEDDWGYGGVVRFDPNAVPELSEIVRNA